MMIVEIKKFRFVCTSCFASVETEGEDLDEAAGIADTNHGYFIWIETNKVRCKECGEKEGFAKQW